MEGARDGRVLLYCVLWRCGVVEKMGGRVQSSGRFWNTGKSPRKLLGNFCLSSTPKAPPLISLTTLFWRAMVDIYLKKIDLD